MLSLLLLPGLASTVLAQYSATYLPDNAPDTTEEGQTGTNKCGTGSNQTSMCQNAYINSVNDFCLFAPPEPGAHSTIGETERIEVAWCLQPGMGTRVIPSGAITGAHFVKTPDYVQITGIGDLTKINVPQGDAGGELDPHGADGNGNPIGGLVFSNAYGQLVQIHEWTNFMSATEFCFRACKDGPNAPALCQHIYDEMGCEWNMPANYNPGVFENCAGDTGEPMGVYGGSTFHQGDPATPGAHPAPSSSQCSSLTAVGAAASATSSATTSSVSTSSSGSSSVGSPFTGSGTRASSSGSKTSSSGGASNTGAAQASSGKTTTSSSLPIIIAATFGMMLGAVIIL